MKSKGEDSIKIKVKYRIIKNKGTLLERYVVQAQLPVSKRWDDLDIAMTLWGARRLLGYYSGTVPKYEVIEEVEGEA